MDAFEAVDGVTPQGMLAAGIPLQPETGFGTHVEDKVNDGEVGEETRAGGKDLVVGDPL